MTLDNKFDPFTATLEEAIEASKDMGFENPSLPIHQYNSAQQINAMREAIEGGDGFTVLACIRKIVTHSLITPEWLAIAFNKRYDSVLNCQAKSWNDPKAFGRPYPPSFRLNAARKARIGRLAVYNEIRERLGQNDNLAIDKSLFESVGKKFNFGTTLTEEYYYQAKKMLNKKSR